MKPKLIVNSLADLPAQKLSFAAAGAGRAMNLSQRQPVPSLRTVEQDPMGLGQELYSRAGAWFRDEQPWPRGGLNE